MSLHDDAVDPVDEQPYANGHKSPSTSLNIDMSPSNGSLAHNSLRPHTTQPITNGSVIRSLDDVDIQIENDNGPATAVATIVPLTDDVRILRKGNSFQMRRGHSDSNIQTVLWQNVSLVVWPAIDADSLVQQTVIRCINNSKSSTVTVETQTEYIGCDVSSYMRLSQQQIALADTAQSHSGEVIL